MIPFQIDSVVPNSPAAEIDIQRGDRIVKVNERKIYTLQDMQEELRNEIDEHALLEVQRLENNDTITFVKEVRLDPQKRIGVFTREQIHYTAKSNSFPEALVKGVKNTFSNLIGYVKGLFTVVASKPIKSRPVGISSAFWK
jgi:C-terminal processing protease CtpA/Prc